MTKEEEVKRVGGMERRNFYKLIPQRLSNYNNVRSFAYRLCALQG